MSAAIALAVAAAVVALAVVVALAAIVVAGGYRISHSEYFDG